MQALVWEAPRQMVMRQQEDPSPGPYEVLVRVSYAGICGSELSGYLGHNTLRVPPIVMGHEFSGKIVELGAHVKDRKPELKKDQAVTVLPLTSCGACDLCRRGLNHLCSQRQLVGAHRPGAYAQFVSVPVDLVVPLPDTLSLRKGALVEPAAVGIRIGELAGDVQDGTALVIGAGPIGLLALQCLQDKGASRVFIADLDKARLQMGADLGGDALDPNEVDLVKTVRDATDGVGVPVAVDAVGTAGTRSQCISAAQATGTVIFSGLHEEESTVPAADIIRREIVVRGSFAYSPQDFAQAIEALESGRLHLEPWIVEAPLAEGGRWFERLIEAPGNVSKVLLIP